MVNHEEHEGAVRLLVEESLVRCGDFFLTKVRSGSLFLIPVSWLGKRRVEEEACFTWL